jgi:hypothetical protein
MKKITITLLSATMMVSSISAMDNLQRLRGDGQRGGDQPGTPLRNEFAERRRLAESQGPDTPTIVNQATSRINQDEDIPEGLRLKLINMEVREKKSERDQQREEAIERLDDEESRRRLERSNLQLEDIRRLERERDEALIQSAEERVRQSSASNEQLVNRISQLERQITESEERERNYQQVEAQQAETVQRMERELLANGTVQQRSEAENERLSRELETKKTQLAETRRNLRAAELEKQNLRNEVQVARESQQRLRETLNTMGAGRLDGQLGGVQPGVQVHHNGVLPQGGVLPVAQPQVGAHPQPLIVGAGEQQGVVVVQPQAVVVQPQNGVGFALPVANFEGDDEDDK